jgi:hypothetical protein
VSNRRSFTYGGLDRIETGEAMKPLALVGWLCPTIQRNNWVGATASSGVGRAALTALLFVRADEKVEAQGLPVRVPAVGGSSPLLVPVVRLASAGPLRLTSEHDR